MWSGVRIPPGRPIFVMIIDLHGYTVHQAWNIFNSRVTQAYYDGHRTCKIITGYGQISSELNTWAANHDKVRACNRQDPNQGAFVLKLIKRK